MSTKRLVQLSLIMVLVLASLMTASRSSALSSCNSTYVVQRGDWMMKIARRCGVTLSALYAANPSVGYYIYPGQVLTIPGGDPGGSTGGLCGPGTDAYGNIYIVCPGDSLGRIAAYYGTTWQRLQAINSIGNPNRIFPGQFLRIY